MKEELKMRERFGFIYEMLRSNMEKLDKQEIDVDHAKAVAALAKQANNVLTTQLEACKFMSNVKDAKSYFDEVGL